jgi:hypothetical protein
LYLKVPGKLTEGAEMRVLLAVLILVFIPILVAGNEPMHPATEIVQKAKQTCNDFENGIFQTTQKTITLHDITGDGRLEQFVDASQFSCSSALTLWGGTGGTYLWIVVDGKPHEFLGKTWKVVEVDEQPVLLLAVHSSQCSDVIGPCYRAFAWQDGFRTVR